MNHGSPIPRRRFLAGSLTIREGRVMVQAARKHQRVFQVGTRQRSMLRNRKATELLRNGRLGKITDVVCERWDSSRPYTDFDIPAEPIPEGMDWDAWCGQTEPVAYNERVYRNYNNPGWYNLRRYSGGNLANAGSHTLDIVQWDLGTDDTGPVEVWAESSSPSARLMYRYANGVKLHLGFPPELLEETESGELKEPGEQPSEFVAIFYGNVDGWSSTVAVSTRYPSLSRKSPFRPTPFGYTRVTIISRTGWTVSVRAPSRPPI